MNPTIVKAILKNHGIASNNFDYEVKRMTPSNVIAVTTTEGEFLIKIRPNGVTSVTPR